MNEFALSPPKKLLLASVLIAFLGSAATAPAQPDPPAQAGRISSITGNVSFQPLGTDDWQQAFPNLPLGPGDRIFTDENSRVEVQVGQTFVRIGPNSDFSLVDSTPTGLYFGLAQGSMHMHAESLWEGQSVFVNTPSGSSALAQPGELRVDVFPGEQAAVFTDFSGYYDITGAEGFEQPLNDGYALELIGSNPVMAKWVQPSGWDDLDQWSHRRDQQIAQSMSYRYVSPEIPGAYELDAAGNWEAGSPYGPIWFPNNVPYGWAPYHYGHWVNHAPWGWVWVEDESWGYAPFHYGRWVNYNGRWGWVAGPPAAHPIWSPALVVFAGGIRFGGVGVSAWFPLGPGEAYRPWYPCSPRYFDQVNRTNIIESQRVHVQNSYVNVNVTNITYVNQTTAVTAMRQEDFAAGRPVRQAAVAVDPQQFQHVQPLGAPLPRPTLQARVGPPPARPVPVSTMRPVLINERGMATAAAPGARPMPPPVKPVPQFHPLVGHTVVAPPPNAKPLPQANIPGNLRPPAPSAPNNSAERPFQGAPPRAIAPPVEKPVVPSNPQQEFKQAPETRQVERPNPLPNPRPEFKPAPEPPAKTPPRTDERPPAPVVTRPTPERLPPPPPPKSDKDKKKKDEPNPK